MAWFKMTWHDFNEFQVTDLCGHEDRILQLAMSPDGSSVASVSADVPLKLISLLWKLHITNPGVCLYHCDTLFHPREELRLHPYARFEIFTAVKIQVRVWAVILCSFAVGYQCYERPCILTKFVKCVELIFHLCMGMRKLFYNHYILGHNKTWRFLSGR
jgi:hypothetical protein